MIAYIELKIILLDVVMAYQRARIKFYEWILMILKNR